MFNLYLLINLVAAAGIYGANRWTGMDADHATASAFLFFVFNCFADIYRKLGIGVK